MSLSSALPHPEVKPWLWMDQDVTRKRCPACPVGEKMLVWRVFMQPRAAFSVTEVRIIAIPISPRFQRLRRRARFPPLVSITMVRSAVQRGYGLSPPLVHIHLLGTEREAKGCYKLEREGNGLIMGVQFERNRHLPHSRTSLRTRPGFKCPQIMACSIRD